MGLDLYEIDLPWLGRLWGRVVKAEGTYIFLLGSRWRVDMEGKGHEGGDGDGKRWRRREGVWRMEMERPRVQSTP